MPRKTPTRKAQRAARAAKHEALHVIMREPEESVLFPVSFGRIAMTSAIWGAVALGVLAIAVLSSAVFMMRDEVADLGRRLQDKDSEVGFLSGELQKVRDQMFGEQEEAVTQGIVVQLVDAESGLLTPVTGVLLKDTPYPLGPESRTVNGKYLYWTDEEGILRVNLEDSTVVRLVTKPFVSSLAVSKDGSWLAYAYSEGLSDPESVRKTRAVAMPLDGRGDAIELGELPAASLGGVPKIHGFSSDGKELLWTTSSDEEFGSWTLYRTRITNGQETGTYTYVYKQTESSVGLTPDGSTHVVLEGKWQEDGEAGFNAEKLTLIDVATGKRRVRYAPVRWHQVSGNPAWTVDESALVLWDEQEEYLALPMKGIGEPLHLGKMDPFVEPAAQLVSVSPDSFILTVAPSLVGRYGFRNLSTGAVASVDGPFAGIAGWSSDLNAVVLIADTRE